MTLTRLIDLSGAAQVELWPGRKLLIPNDEQPLLISLPRGAASAYLRGNSCSIAFGSPGRSTVMVAGTKPVIKALWEAIVEDERPERVIRIG